MPKLWNYGGIDKPKLVIVGAGEFGDIAHEYFVFDSPYEVVGFAVEREYLAVTEKSGLPVVPVEEMEQHFEPGKHSAFVAITYTKLNRVRTRLAQLVKAKGYDLARYVSSQAFVWHNVSVGENVFVFEQNVVQHHARLSDNVILWSGNHIGHRSSIAANCYLASHVVVSGYCDIGESCFIGVNVSISDNVTIGRDCLIGAGATVLKDVPENSILASTMTPTSAVSSLRFHRIPKT